MKSDTLRLWKILMLYLAVDCGCAQVAIAMASSCKDDTSNPLHRCCQAVRLRHVTLHHLQPFDVFACKKRAVLSQDA
jgi:hypothetical protein